ncbi:MAG: hypothetical protein ACRENI_11175 [Gemmatimonadaceae bacterium]
MRKIFATVATASFVAAAVPASAQEPDVSDVVSYLALVTTPVGALPPSLGSAMLESPSAGVGFGARYGWMDLDGSAVHNLGLGVDFVAPWSGDLGLTLGYSLPDCPDGVECDGNFMGGASWQTKVSSMDVGTSSRVNLGVDAQLGLARSDDGAGESVTAMSVALSLPVALVTGSAGGIRIAPFVSPGFGYGRISGTDPVSGDGVSESGTRFLLGGGASLMNASGSFAFNAGVQKVFIDQGDIQFGVGMSFHPGR